MRLTRAEIDLESLRFNFNGIRQRVGRDVKIMGIVKANAYGHGLAEVARALTRFGADYLGVGFLEEGIALRREGITTPVLVLGGVLGNQVGRFLEYKLDITVSSLELAERIELEVTSGGGKRADVHLKIDTGMERIGVRAENALQFIEKVSRLKNLRLLGIYSHFATSDERDKTFAYQQLDRFSAVVERTKQLGIDIPLVHIANSGAVLDMPESHFTLVRPGMMLYGVYPSKETTESIPLRPVLSLKSQVVFLKEVAQGVSVSYGRKYFTPSATRIATVPVGYGDGYSRRLTNQTGVIIRGKRVPVVGTICMDQFMVDVSPGSDVHVGDDVVLIGTDEHQSITAWDLSEKLGTNPYEVLTGITARVPRIFINGNG